MYARRLQIQEQMTRQIAEFLQGVLKPMGVAVVVEGSPLCGDARREKVERPHGDQRHAGHFKRNQSTRAEFLANIGRQGQEAVGRRRGAPRGLVTPGAVACSVSAGRTGARTGAPFPRASSGTALRHGVTCCRQ